MLFSRLSRLFTSVRMLSSLPRPILRLKAKGWFTSRMKLFDLNLDSARRVDSSFYLVAKIEKRFL
jgi:hypothetical protein